ncbi:hypothetical protein ACLI4Z_18030 [Natrialbaceae archaeon A-arb3/5]
MATNNGLNPSGIVNDYANLRTVPALLSVFFAMASLYQFGAVSDLHIEWFDYTLTSTHAIGGSLAVYLIAFASSQTKSFDHYEDWEKVTIASGPVLIIGYEYLPYLPTAIEYHDPATFVLAWLVAMASYGVAVR